MSDQPIRASDQEWLSVVDALLDAFTEGRLTVDELQERTAAAYAARSRGPLREPAGDHPVQPLPGPGSGTPPAAPVGQGAVARRRRSGRIRPYDRALPVLFVVVVVAAALSFVFICMLACRIAYGGRW